MEYNKAVADMLPGMDVEGFYLISAASVKRTTAGKPFLACVISDASGNIEAKAWDFNGVIRDSDNGKVVKIQGSVTEFRGASQLTVNKFRFADDRDAGHYDIADLVPTAPISVDSALDDVREIIDGIEDADYRTVAETMLERHLDAFKKIPAAKSVHHSFLSGLLMHTYNMMRLADYLAYQYSEVIDRSLLITGTLLHDFAKEREFTFSNLGLVTEYSVSGDLIGHLVMGAQEVAELSRELSIPAEKSMLLQHLILSHHGEPERGAAVVPKCAEAELLSFIDQIDSRMEIYAEAFEGMDVGTFSPRIFALDKRIYRHR